MVKLNLDTYEVILDDVHFECLGSSKEDAQVELKEWLDKYTEGYKLKGIKFKRHGL